MKTSNRSLKDFGKKRVLIIDDDRDILTSMRDFFELEEYAVVTSQNGQEAMDHLKALSDKELPDLIILDFMMPVMDGVEFHRNFRADKRFNKIPVVMTTASGKIRQLINETDFEAFLEKPVNIDELSRVSLNFIHRRSDSQFSFLA